MALLTMWLHRRGMRKKLLKRRLPSPDLEREKPSTNAAGETI